VWLCQSPNLIRPLTSHPHRPLTMDESHENVQEPLVPLSTEDLAVNLRERQLAIETREKQLSYLERCVRADQRAANQRIGQANFESQYLGDQRDAYEIYAIKKADFFERRAHELEQLRKELVAERLDVLEDREKIEEDRDTIALREVSSDVRENSLERRLAEVGRRELDVFERELAVARREEHLKRGGSGCDTERLGLR
jgi:hypothetical protein